MIIYELSVDSIDATEFFFPIPEEKEKLMELIEDKISNEISVKNEWAEFLVLKREPKIDVDFYDIDDWGVCILNQKAYDIYSPLLNESIEILPLKSDDQNYYLISVIEATDCLDKEQLDHTSLETGDILESEKISFDPDKVVCPFFRIPEIPYVTMISDKVIELYYLHELKGLNLSDEEYIGES